MIDRDAVGDRLEQHRLAGLGRADDQAALTASHRRDEVDDAAGQLSRVVGLEVEALVREDRGEILEVGPRSGFVAADPVDEVDAGQAVVLFALLRRPHRANHVVPGAQAGAPDQALRDVHVGRRGEQRLAAQESIGVVDDFEHSAREYVALGLGLRLQNAQHDVLLLQARQSGDVHVACLGEEFLAGQVLKIGNAQGRHLLPRVRGVLRARRWVASRSGCLQVRERTASVGNLGLIWASRSTAPCLLSGAVRGSRTQRDNPNPSPVRDAKASVAITNRSRSMQIQAACRNQDTDGAGSACAESCASAWCQSSRNDWMPLSVSGCCCICSSTENGIVAM